MEGIDHYKQRLQDLVQRLDLSQDISDELLTTFDEIIDHLQIDTDLSVAELQEELGSPQQFVSDYLESRVTSRDISTDAEFITSVRSVLQKGSELPALSTSVHLLLTISVTLFFSLISGFGLAFFILGLGDIQIKPPLYLLLPFFLFYLYFYCGLLFSLFLGKKKGWIYTPLLIVLVFLGLPVVSYLILNRTFLGPILFDFGGNLFEWLPILLTIGFSGIMIFAFVPSLAIEVLSVYGQLVSYAIIPVFLIFWAIIIYQSIRWIAPKLLYLFDRIFPEPDIIIEDEVGQEHAIPYLTLIERMQRSFEQKRQEDGTLGMLDTTLNQLHVRSLTGAKFAPQFDRLSLIISAILTAIIIMGYITQYFGFPTIFLIFIYIFYEALSGLTGIHVTSRRTAIRLRQIFRLLLLFGAVFSFLTTLLGFITSFGTLVSHFYWVEVLVGLELVIFLRENIRGLVPLTYQSDSQYLPTAVLLFVVILTSSYTFGVSTFVGNITLIVVFFALQLLFYLITVRINPEISIAITSLSLYVSLDTLFYYDLSPLYVLLTVILLVATYGLASVTYYQQLYLPSIEYTSDHGSQLDFDKIVELIDDLERWLHNFLLKYHLKFSYLLTFVVVILSIVVIPDLLDSTAAPITGHPQEYYMMPYIYKYLAFMVGAILLLIFFISIEIGAKPVAENTCNLSLRQVLNLKKVMFLAIVLIISLSAIAAATEYSDHQFYQRVQGPSGNQPVYGDLVAYWEVEPAELGDNLQSISFLKTTNSDPSAYQFNNIRSYLPLAVAQVELVVDGWRPTVELVIVNQTLYDHHVNTWNNSITPVNLNAGFYFTRQFFYDDIMARTPSTGLGISTAGKDVIITSSQINVLDDHTGLYPHGTDIFTLFTSFAFLQALDLDITDLVNDRFQSRILFDHDQSIEVLEDDEMDYQIISMMEDEVFDTLEIDEFSSTNIIYVEPANIQNYDTSYDRLRVEGTYWYISIGVLLVSAAITALIFIFLILHSSYITTRSHRLKLYSIGTILFVLSQLVGTAVGLFSSIFVFEGIPPQFSPDILVQDLMTTLLLQLLVFAGISILGLRSDN